MIATEKLWITADRKKVVKDGDKKARFLLCVPGQTIPKDVVKKYGLDSVEEKKKPGRKKKENVDNKSVERVENKGE